MADRQNPIPAQPGPTGSESQNCASPQSEAGIYEIRVKGHLSIDWIDWLEGFEMRLLENGETLFSGPIVDQSALMGVLYKLCRLNLMLLSINPMKERKNE
jgi:hypothetical protein